MHPQKVKILGKPKERKELRISFARNEPEFDPICVNCQTLETVRSVKLLGLNISLSLSLSLIILFTNVQNKNI